MNTPHSALATTALLLGWLLAFRPASAAGPTRLQSPDGNVRFDLSIEAAGQLNYAVTRKGHFVIEPSRLNMVVDGVDLSQSVTLNRTERYAIKRAISVAWRSCRSR